MASGRWCDSRSTHPDHDHLGITAWVPAVGEGVDWGPFCRLGRRVFQQLAGVMLHSSWLVLG